jgi:rhodanese-related sulfurtransferase
MQELPCKEVFERCIQTLQVSDKDLLELLTCKEQNLLDFLLVDIREIFEYMNQSIAGTDLLLPTTTLHETIGILEENKEKFILLYCRTGNRTSHVLGILKRKGFEKIAHLSDGIVGYSGKKLKNAPLPQERNI